MLSPQLSPQRSCAYRTESPTGRLVDRWRASHSDKWAHRAANLSLFRPERSVNQRSARRGRIRQPLFSSGSQPDRGALRRKTSGNAGLSNRRPSAGGVNAPVDLAIIVLGNTAFCRTSIGQPRTKQPDESVRRVSQTGGRQQRTGKCMGFHDVVILFPGHGLEDFPTDLPDDKAAGLLNAFAVAWHPALLAAVKSLPVEHRADVPPALPAGRLILVPPACDETVPTGRVDQAARRVPRSSPESPNVMNSNARCLRSLSFQAPRPRNWMPTSSPTSSHWERAGCSSSC